MYARFLADLDFEAGQLAVRLIVEDRTHFPAIAEIRAVAKAGNIWAIRGMTPAEIETFEVPS